VEATNANMGFPPGVAEKLVSREEKVVFEVF